MKKFIYLFSVIALCATMATSCFEDSDSKYNTKTVSTVVPEMLIGRTFAQQPYGGTSWGDQTWEVLKFNEDGTCFVGLGSLEEPEARYHGTWSCDGSKAVQIQDLKVFDHMSGQRFNIVRAEVGLTKTGKHVVYLGFDNGNGLEWDLGLVYPEVEIKTDVVVNPWGSENYTINL